MAAADVDEEAQLVSEPTLSALNVALAKARAVHANTEEIIVAADTLVVVEGEVLGKPAGEAEARAMLQRLRGRAHQVLTGVVLQQGELTWAAVVATRVELRDYADADIAAYIARGEPFDKAGGYAIQDATLRPVERLSGCYLNVVGLPLCAVAAGLTALGASAEPASAPACQYCERGRPLVSRSG